MIMISQYYTCCLLVNASPQDLLIFDFLTKHVDTGSVPFAQIRRETVCALSTTNLESGMEIKTLSWISATHPAEKKRPAASGCTRSGGPMWSKGRSVCGIYVVRKKRRPPFWAAALMRRTSVLRLYAGPWRRRIHSAGASVYRSEARRAEAQKKNHTFRCGFSFGGDCWTRTSDLLRVKQAL